MVFFIGVLALFFFVARVLGMLLLCLFGAWLFLLSSVQTISLDLMWYNWYLLQLFCVYIYFVQIVLIDFDYKVWSWGYMKCWVTWSQRRRKIYVRTCMELEVLRSNCLLLWELKYSICVYLLISYACCFKFLITCSLSVSNSSAKTRLCKLWISFKYCH